MASVTQNNVCSKKSYPTKLDALLKLDEIARADRADRQEKRAYYCYSCAAFHLTSRS